MFANYRLCEEIGDWMRTTGRIPLQGAAPSDAVNAHFPMTLEDASL